jgi:uncharacterized surface protein with fasciclin (FAS1) repeats
MIKNLLIAILLLPTFVFGQNTVVDVIVGSDDHNTLEAAVLAAGLETTLSSEGPFTVFAPTDDAFSALPAGLVDQLLENPGGALTNILLQHVASGTALSTDLNDGDAIPSLFGQELNVVINGNGIFIDGALVTIADINADNGVVHVIDAVIVPEGNFNTIMDIVSTSDAHNTLQAALILTGLNEILNSEGPFTVFAPTDAAFQALPNGVLDALLADPMGALTSVLLYHVADGNVTSDQLSDGQEIITINGNTVTVSIDNGMVMINDALVTIADIQASNGVVHVIDAVLVPPTPVGLPVDFELPADSYNFVGFEGADSAIESNPDQSGINTSATIMRSTKTDGAQFFAGTLIDLDENIDFSSNAVLNIDTWSPKADIPIRIALESNGGGNQIFVDVNTTVANEWETLSADFSGLIDPNVEYGRVVVFFEFVVNLPGDGTTYYFDNIRLAPLPTIVDIVVGSDVHNTLEAAVIAAGLVETLQGDGPFTVFAPTDDAFNNLPDGVLDALLADPMGALTSVLLYHVADGNITSDQLSDGQEIITVNGNTVTVSIDNGMVMINDALVTIADIQASNGVVHVIDAVLVPPTNTVLDIIQGSSVHTTLATAINLAGLESTLQGDGPFTVFAPTDAAFEALPDGVLDALLMDPEGALRDVLLYHVVAGTRLAASLNDGESITTVLGQDVNVSITSEGVFINTAQVTMADLEGDNGIVHVIDAVLTPTTSTKDQIIEIAEVYPNPVNDMLQYDISSLTKELLTVTIYDNQGRIVTRLKNNPTLGIFDVNTLSNGVYTIVFENNEIVAKNRLMKM